MTFGGQMTPSQAIVPVLIDRTKTRWLSEALAVFGGVALLSALAQVVIHLPWTPVPITGQTFGIALLALSWGRKRAVAAMVSYLAIGALGVPVFALGQTGLSFGPTMGYLVGMLFATFAV